MTEVRSAVRCWCNRLAAYGTDYCQYHGARRVEVQLKADQCRLQRALTAHHRWVAELETRWVRAGQAPAVLRSLVVEGRLEEVVAWLDRHELGW